MPVPFLIAAAVAFMLPACTPYDDGSTNKPYYDYNQIGSDALKGVDASGMNSL